MSLVDLTDRLLLAEEDLEVALLSSLAEILLTFALDVLGISFLRLGTFDRVVDPVVRTVLTLLLFLVLAEKELLLMLFEV